MFKTKDKVYFELSYSPTGGGTVFEAVIVSHKIKTKKGNWREPDSVTDQYVVEYQITDHGYFEKETTDKRGNLLRHYSKPKMEVRRSVTGGDSLYPRD